MTDSEIAANNVQKVQHDENKEKVRDLMKMDTLRARDDTTVCTVNFDLQKVLTTPKSPVGTMYYYSKLCVWNFTMYETGPKTGVCNLWNETIGKRGSNELASYVQKFIENKVEVGIKEFVFYTDNCGGQNRNQNMFSMYFRESNKLNVTITHR